MPRVALLIGQYPRAGAWRRRLRPSVGDLSVPCAALLAIEPGQPGGNDYGIDRAGGLSITLFTRQAHRPIDLYIPQVVPTGEIDLGTQNLTAGEHRLSIGIVGANPAATKAYMVGLDYARLEPVQE